jgi:hypothetical protein
MHISQSNHHEREEFEANIKINNLKNELQAFTLNQDDFYNTSSILFDINENRQDFTIFILNELHDLLQDNTKNIDIDNENIFFEYQSFLINDKTKYVLSYAFSERIIFKNN